MKKLRFEEVLDYLESGEDDPQFEQFIEADPDGPGMLEQAKRLFTLLREQAEEDGGGEVHGSSSRTPVAGSAPGRIVKASRVIGRAVTGDLFDEDRPNISVKEVMAAAKLGRRAAGRIRSIGELTIAARETDMLLSFEPDLPRDRPDFRRDQPPGKGKQSSTTYYQSAPAPRGRRTLGRFMDYLSDGTSGGELRIQGAGLEILVGGTLEHYAPIQFRATDTRLQAPARGLTLIFMPEHGPFTKIVTDSKGFAELALPEHPGILRIESTVPQLIQIRTEY